jgi:ferredoxin
MDSEIIVEVDHDRCTGHARCNAESPEIFELDEFGYSSITRLTVASDRRAEADAGASACPERAIAVWLASKSSTPPDGTLP